MVERVQLHAETRQMLGKKVRRLRRLGILPATVYGHRIQPQSIQLQARAVSDLIRRTGSKQLIDLMIDNQPARPVLIKQTTVDAKKNAVIHVEFFQANLREKMTMQIPLHFVGESPAVRDGGIFLPVIDHITVESLPQDIPAYGIEVDLSRITEINGTIHASDLALPPSVTLVEPAPDELLAKVNPPESQESVDESIGATEPLPSELGGDERSPNSIPGA